MIERIAAAAVQTRGLIVSLPPPARHHDVIHAMFRAGWQEQHGDDDAFLTSKGRFVGRREALSIAQAAGQITARGLARLEDGAQVLFSEDVW